MAGRVLLTGAGFTKSYGGFLAREFWAWLLNAPPAQSQPALRDQIKADFDFESVYSRITDSRDRRAMTAALETVYDRQERQIWREITEHTPYYIKGWPLAEFLEAYRGGYIFTLNQDVFVERIFSNRGKRANRPDLIIPGVQKQVLTVGQQKGQIRPFQIPTDSEIAESETRGVHLIDGQVAYVKLHGSMNWLSPTGDKEIVIGTSKEADIEGRALLQWYWQIFEDALASVSPLDVWIVGYSFRDRHINRVLAARANEPGLRLFVVDAARPEDFKARLDSQCEGRGAILWSALQQYYPCQMGEIYPRRYGNEKTETARLIDLALG
jgi:hypothetical protein